MSQTTIDITIYCQYAINPYKLILIDSLGFEFEIGYIQALNTTNDDNDNDNNVNLNLLKFKMDFPEYLSNLEFIKKDVGNIEKQIPFNGIY